jgi:hypothetical protein
VSTSDRARTAVRDRDPAGLLRLLLGDDGAAAAAALAPAGADASDAATQEVLRAAAEQTPGEDVWTFADQCFVRGGLAPEARLVCTLAIRADARSRMVLQRSVIGPVLGTDAGLDAVYAGLSFSDEAARADHLSRVRDALAAADAAELEELARPAALPPPPDGHELIAAHAGIGKTSRVCRVRRTADGAELAWKIPVDDGPRTRRDMELAVERSSQWVELGISSSPIVWGPGRASLLQPFVAGPTLEERIRADGVPRPDCGTEHEQLVGLVLGLVGRGGYVSGLNASNLVFDGERWQVIDSGAVHRLSGVREAWPRQRKDLLRKWTRGGGRRRQAQVLAFLEQVESRLDPADRPSAAARLVRRLRGLG